MEKMTAGSDSRFAGRVDVSKVGASGTRTTAPASAQQYQRHGSTGRNHIECVLLGAGMSFGGYTTMAAAEVSFQWNNPDFLIRNPDFPLRNPDFLLNNVDFLIKTDRPSDLVSKNDEILYLKRETLYQNEELCMMNLAAA